MKHDHLHALYIVVLVLVLALYAGCSTYQSKATVNNFRTGVQAVELQWKAGNPTRVYVNEPLDLFLQIRNRGTTPIGKGGAIPEGQLYLSGYDPQYLNFDIEPVSSFALEGKNQFDPNGDMADIKTLHVGRVIGPNGVGQFPQSIIVAACYQYITKAVASVCIDSDPYNKITRQKACTTSTVSVGGQGAPIVVSSVEPIMGNQEVRFNIRLANSGNGVAFYGASLDQCGSGLSYTQTDKVRVSKVLFGGVPLDCNPSISSPVWLNSGTASIMCTCNGPGCVDLTVPAYQTLLEVDLQYGYRNSLSTQITIVNDQ